MHQKSDVLKLEICFSSCQKGGNNQLQLLGGQQGEEGGTWGRGCGADVSARGGFGQCPWSVGSASVVLAQELRCPVPVLGTFLVLANNNDNDCESCVHVPPGLCRKTFTSKSNPTFSLLSNSQNMPIKMIIYWCKGNPCDI